MTSEKSRILFRVQRPETKEALKKMAADQERSVSYLLDRMAVAMLQERGYLPKGKRKPKQ